jgi:hypothetical protein
MINTGAASQSVRIGLRHLPPGGWAVPYLTDATDQVAPQQPVPVINGQLSVFAPPRSVVTVVQMGCRAAPGAGVTVAAGRAYQAGTDPVIVSARWTARSLPVSSGRAGKRLSGVGNR